MGRELLLNIHVAVWQTIHVVLIKAKMGLNQIFSFKTQVSFTLWQSYTSLRRPCSSGVCSAICCKSFEARFEIFIPRFQIFEARLQIFSPWLKFSKPASKSGTDLWILHPSLKCLEPRFESFETPGTAYGRLPNRERYWHGIPYAVFLSEGVFTRHTQVTFDSFKSEINVLRIRVYLFSSRQCNRHKDLLFFHL